jgi:hypothetical protein
MFMPRGPDKGVTITTAGALELISIVYRGKKTSRFI